MESISEFQWRHKLTTDELSIWGTKEKEKSPRVLFMLERERKAFHNFDVLPAATIAIHDIGRYPSVGLHSINDLQKALEATSQPAAPSYTAILFEIGQSLGSKIEAGRSRQEALSEIYNEWENILHQKEVTPEN